ncbi:MAG: T9SS type A sorting domain-containing protein, partial [bacterium]
DLTSFTAKPDDNAITLNWSILTDEQISGFNLYRRVANPTTNPNLVGTDYNLSNPGGENTYSRKNPDTQWTKVNTSLITGTNPYSYTDRGIAPNTTYEYKLEAVVSDKSETLGTTECTSGNGMPTSFGITRVYPTPADDIINIDVIIPEKADIDIGVYDIMGRRVSTIAGGQYNSGEYTIVGDVSYLTDGVYIVRMTTDGFSASKRFVIAR